jgi:hypothetical protein
MQAGMSGDGAQERLQAGLVGSRVMVIVVAGNMQSGYFGYVAINGRGSARIIREIKFLWRTNGWLRGVLSCIEEAETRYANVVFMQLKALENSIVPFGDPFGAGLPKVGCEISCLGYGPQLNFDKKSTTI